MKLIDRIFGRTCVVPRATEKRSDPVKEIWDLMDAQILLATLPAFPKPHIRPIGGGRWECTRHVFQDEFMSAQGDSPKAAYNACDPWHSFNIEVGSPAWAERYLCPADRPMNVSSLRHGLYYAK